MIIDGKAIAAKVRAEVAQAVKEIEKRAGVTPGLALIRVGNDPASEIYVRGKAKACQETGMAGFEHILSEQTSEVELLALIRELNVNPHVHGVLVAAVGKPAMIRGEWVKRGATVIDVGMNRNAAGKLVGDVEFTAAAERARAITPVPGGVGPMTIAYLLSNTIQAAKAQLSLG